MNIDYIRKKVYKHRVEKHREAMDPQKMYNEMRENIAAIAGTAGFKEIVRFFEREVELHEKRLDQIKEMLAEGKKVNQIHIKTVLANQGVAKKFLMFLANILSN
jgi:hypothetical protein